MLIIRRIIDELPVLIITFGCIFTWFDKPLLTRVKKTIQITVFFLLSSFSIAVFSQSEGAFVNDDVAVILADIESQNKTRSIYGVNSYGVNSRKKIADIPFSTRFKIVKRLGKWSVIEFNQPTVPGWVSRRYVNIKGGRVTVNVNHLNLRFEPSLNSPVMLQLERSYTSILTGQKNGFVNIYAPKNYRVAIFSGDSSDAALSLSNRRAVSSVKSIPRIIPSHSSSSLPSSNLDLPVAELTVIARNNSEESGKEIEVANLFDASINSERLHVIAPGDAVSLLVFGEKDLSIGNVRVPQSGRVAFPLIGSVLVAGRTIPQIEQSVAELLEQGYVKNPRLSVTIFSYRPVFIRGAVKETGSFPFSEGLTVGKIIALAGGRKKSAKENGVSILRGGNVVESGLSIESVVEVQSGDVITIDEEVGVQEGDASYIYLHGEVASPGEYQFRRGLTVEKAIVLGGGFTLRGSRKKISVTRYADGDVGQEPKKMKKVKLYTPIKPGDIINVGATWF